MTKHYFSGAGLIVAFGLTALLWAGGAAAQDEVHGSTAPSVSQNAPGEGEPSYEEKSAYGPIQRRKYQMKHELSLGFSYLPLDAYYKGYGVQVAYTIHFSPLFAVELFRLGWSHNVDTNLKKKILDLGGGGDPDNPGPQKEHFPAVVFFEQTNVIFNVLYGKQSFLNRYVAHFELFVTGGGTFVYRDPFTILANGFGSSKYARFEFGLNLGLGFRFWIDPTWSIRVDVRDTMLLMGIQDAKFDCPLKQTLLVGLMASINL